MVKGTVATATRDILAIKKRKFFHYTFRMLQEIARVFKPQNAMRKTLFYPKFETRREIVDVLNRASWYLPADSIPEGSSLYVCVEGRIDINDAVGGAPEDQAFYDGTALPVQVVEARELDETMDDVDEVLLWDAETRHSLPALRNIEKIEIVDPEYWSTIEAGTWSSVGHRLRKEGRDRSANLYRRLEDRFCDVARSYVFATGPGLAEALQFDFPEGPLKIVCNSIVRNRSMLDHIDPDVLVFADPVFHFGPSKYADRFRQDAIATLRRYDCIGVIPEQHLSLMNGHYPDVDFVALRGENLNEPNFPTHDDLRVMGTNNVMTLFMLPIASALTEQVNIIGADGREKNESYFWEHDEDAQYDDELMRTAVNCHPSFFRDRVYTDYYDDHVDTLESMIEYGEKQGISYQNLTHSYIQCLEERSVDDPAEHVAEPA